VQKEYPVKRRFPRFTVLGKVAGKIIATHEATLLNLSLGGALIEHPSMVRPGSVSQLLIPTPRGDIQIDCRVARSTLVRQERRGNEAMVIYQTGLEFRDPSPEVLAALEGVIAASRPGGGTPGETTITFLLMDLPFPPV
jgi:hypothetical protein